MSRKCPQCGFDLTWRFDPEMLGEPSRIALSSLLRLRRGWYRRVQLARAMAEAGGVTVAWSEEMLRRSAEVGAVKLRRVGATGQRRVEVLVDEFAIGHAWPGWTPVGVPTLRISPVEPLDDEGCW